MYTKSLIQQQIDLINLKNSFKDSLQSLIEKYNVKDNIFVLSEGQLKELTKGYFVKENEYSDLNEAINNCNINNMGIRIINNKLFQIGNIYNSYNECPINREKMILQ